MISGPVLPGDINNCPILSGVPEGGDVASGLSLLGVMKLNKAAMLGISDADGAAEAGDNGETGTPVTVAEDGAIGDGADGVPPGAGGAVDGAVAGAVAGAAVVAGADGADVDDAAADDAAAGAADDAAADVNGASKGGKAIDIADAISFVDNAAGGAGILEAISVANRGIDRLINSWTSSILILGFIVCLISLSKTLTNISICFVSKS